MTAPLTFQGILAGKRLYVTTGRSSGTVAQLRMFLRRFRTCHTLRVVGQFADQLERMGDSTFLAFEDVAVPAHCLPYLALLSIEASDDCETGGVPSAGFISIAWDKTMGTHAVQRGGFVSDRGNVMQPPDLIEAVRLFNDLRDPVEAAPDDDGDAVFEHMLRMGQSQFAHQEALDHLLPRTVLLYQEIWPNVEKANGVRPLEDLKAIVGVDLDRLLLLTVAAVACARPGFFLERRLREFMKPGVGQDAFPDDSSVDRFLGWMSASYDQIRAAAKKYAAPTVQHDPYRFNPLVANPIVRPDVQPEPNSGLVYLVPCWRLLFRRGTVGLYHDLSEHHRGDGKANAFRTAFGHVFQEYIGLLLSEAFGADGVLREFKYGNGADSPDWIVLDQDRAVFVEVKQSAQFMQSKMWGRLDDLRRDLRTTVGQAFKQLHRFEDARTARVAGLERLSRVKQVERLVVTNDDTHWNNWVVREEAIRAGSVPTNFHAHLAPIGDFEHLLGLCSKEPLFDVLARKRANGDDEDFKDWIARESSGAELRNPFLDRKYRELFQGFSSEASGHARRTQDR